MSGLEKLFAGLIVASGIVLWLIVKDGAKAKSGTAGAQLSVTGMSIPIPRGAIRLDIAINETVSMLAFTLDDNTVLTNSTKEADAKETH